MPAGLFGRVSGKTTNSNASAQNGSTGRNGSSTGGAPNGAVRLRGEVGKYNGASTVEYDTANTLPPDTPPVEYACPIVLPCPNNAFKFVFCECADLFIGSITPTP